MSLSRTGTIKIVLSFASMVRAVPNVPAWTTAGPSASPSFLSFSNSSLPRSSYTSASLFSSTTTLASSIPSSDPSLSSTTLVPNQSPPSPLVSDYYISEKTLTETIPWLVTGSETVTLWVYGYGISDTPTLTLTGPLTSTETKTVTTQVIATNPNATSSALPPWDPVPYLDYFLPPYPTDAPSKAAVVASFTSYGRQPECTAAYNAFVATQPTATETYAADIKTTTLPGNQVTEYIQYGTNIIPLYAGNGIYYSNVQVFYWPVTNANTGCFNSGSSSTATVVNETNAARKRDPDPTVLGNEAYATGPDGTSPSIYVAFPTVSAIDGCGPVGPPVTSLTLAFAPGELSTIANQNPGPGVRTTLAFNPADLPCGPRNNGANGFLPNPVNVSSYLPIIALPSKLLAYRSDWATLGCDQDIWEGQDPPFALTPQSQALPAASPAVTVTREPPGPVTTPAVPAETVAPLAGSTAVMQMTTAAGGLLPALEPSSRPSLAVGSLTNDPGAGSAIGNPQSVDPSPVIAGGQSPSLTAATPVASLAMVQPQQAPSTMVAGGFTFTVVPPSTAPVQPVAASRAPIDPQNPNPVPDPSSAAILEGQTLTQGPSSTPTSSPPLIAGVPLSVLNPSTILWGTQTLTLSHPPTTISGVAVALLPAGLVIDGSTTLPLASLLPQLPHTPTLNPTISPAPALQVAGITLVPGGPALTVSGTRLSLGVSSNLVIGSSTILLPPPSPLPPPPPSLLPTATSYIGIGSQTLALALAPSSGAAVIAGGQTLTPGSPAITVDGVRVSLGGSVLVVGSATRTYAALAGSTAAATTTTTPTTGEGGIGAAIVSAFGGGAVATTGTGIGGGNGNGNGTAGVRVQPFAGGAGRGRGEWGCWTAGWVALVLVGGLVVLGVGA
ncbi:Muc22p [Xylographa carneopallida]|nr:Muc22p [Xylographa carneopallida]